MEPHAQWRTNIERRTEDLTGDWWPFVENVKEILDKMIGLKFIMKNL